MKSLNWSHAFSAVFGLMLAALAASPAIANDLYVESALVDRLHSEGSSAMLVYLHERADLSAAHGMDWEERGKFVHQRLVATAGRSQAALRRHLDSRGTEYKAFWIDNVIVIEDGSMALLNDLMAFDEIQMILGPQEVFLIEPDWTEIAIDPRAGRAPEANLNQIGAPAVWAQGITGSGLVVASIDTGVRYTHQALVGSYRGNLGGSFDHNHNWWSPYNASTAPQDSHNHGSHVTGTMTGDDGGSNQIGVAPGAKWIACQGFSPSATNAGLLECGQFLVAPWDLNQNNPDSDMRPHVINNSWGDCGQSYSSWYTGVIDAWIAAGIVPIVSNGNSSNCGYSSPPGLNTVGNPARSGKVLGVGSTGTSNGQYATHSNWGPTDNPNPGTDPNLPDPMGYFNIKPNIAAPGVSIRSSGRNSDTHYYLSTGTSMAGPHAAALVALMWDAAPCLIGDYATTGTIMMQTANGINYASNNGDEGPGNVPNHATGWGEINAVEAVAAAQAECGAQGEVQGTVTRSDTSAPLEGAQVVAVGSVTRSTTTGPGGTYTLEAPEGTYTVTATLAGFGSTSVTDVVVTESGTINVDLALDPAPIASISTNPISLLVATDGAGSATLAIGNDGAGEMNWTIDYDEVLSGPGLMGFVGDFDLANWTFENAPSGVNGSFSTNPGPPVELFILGGNASVGGNSDFWIEIPMDGEISFDWGYFSTDTDDWDSGGYAINGAYTQLANNASQVPFFNGSATVSVSAGDIFAFRVNTQDGQFGAGELGVTNFSFTAAACDTFTSVSWLSANPEFGTTPPESSVDVDVLVDASGLSEGNYSAALCIATDDPSSPLVAVPVHLEVVGELPPVIDVDPSSLSAVLAEDAQTTLDLDISNLGDADLIWNIETAQAPAGQRVLPPFAGGGSISSAAGQDMASLLGGPLPSLRMARSSAGLMAFDCDSEPGIVIQDDGTVENGYSGNPATVAEVRFVDRFTPQDYPADLTGVCVAFLTISGTTSFNIDILVYDDSGSGGTPGAEIGRLAVTVDVDQLSPPVPPNHPPVWTAIDLSSLGVEVTSGSVYVGVGFAPEDPNYFVAADQSTDRPVGFAGGHWWDSNDQVWAAIQTGFGDYRALMVRPVLVSEPEGCDAPEAISWLSLDATSGTTAGGNTSTVEVTLDSTGLAAGTYEALLCINSNDANSPLVQVPVTLTAIGDGTVEPVASISPNSFSFTVAADGSATEDLAISNVGTADLLWSLEDEFGGGGSPTVVLDEDFSGTDFPPTGWSSIKVAGDGSTSWIRDEAQSNSAPASARRVYGISADGFQDDWLITPQIELGTNSELRFHDRGQWMGDYTGSFIQVSTASCDPADGDFELVIERDDTANLEWNEATVDLSAYDNQTVCIAFQYTGTFGHTWWVDDVSVSTNLNGLAGMPECFDFDSENWLSLAPDSGTVAPMQTQLAALTADATGVPEGVYTANVCVYSNDPAANPVVIPVTMEVTDLFAEADISPASFSFQAESGASDGGDLLIGNTGTDTLTWQIDTAEAPSFAYGQNAVAGASLNLPQGADRASGHSPSGSVDARIPAAIQGGPIGEFAEGFDDVEALPGLGWAITNNSAPTGTATWFQGNDAVFASHQGAPNSYVGVNFNSTTGSNTISNWLITPEMELQNGTEIRFWTRAPVGSNFPDRLEVRLSTSGASTDVGSTATSVGDFDTVLVSINENLVQGGYPEAWTEYVLEIEGLAGPTSGRVGFRYYVTEGGPSGNNSDYIGIDTFSVTQPDGGPVPDGCESPSAISWLSVAASGGSTAPGATSTVGVVADASGLAPGNYEALLCVSTNDANAELVEIPVSFVVEAGSEPPTIAVDPTSISASVVSGDTTSESLDISNLGDLDLEWSLVTTRNVVNNNVVAARGGAIGNPASLGDFLLEGGAGLPFDPGYVVSGAFDCSGAEGLVILDDNTIENGYSGNPAVVSSLRFVQRYQPAEAGLLGTVCVNFLSLGPNSLSFDLVVFDADGPDGRPGTQLGSVPATISGLATGLPPGGVPAASNWAAVDLSGLGIVVESGSVYVGVAYAPTDPNVFISSDQSPGTPLATGYWWNDNEGDWINISTSWPDYRAILVRPQFLDAFNCDDPTTVPWLSVSPTSGTTAGGASSTVDLTLDATGLSGGTYEAALCVLSNDPENPVVTVPVTLEVEFTADVGFLEGTVQSAGYCSANPFPAEGALVTAEGSDGGVFTTNAAADGSYSLAISDMESPVTVTFSAPDHFSETVSGVVIEGGETTVVDADLVLQAACASVDPGSFSFSGSGADVLNIGNFGAGAELEWSLVTEIPDAGQRGSLLLLSEDFEGSFPPDGWTTVDATGECPWLTSDDYGMAGWTGSARGAAVDSDDCGSGVTADASMVSPAIDLSASLNTSVSFDLAYRHLGSSALTLDASVDGSTWTNIETWSANFAYPADASLPVSFDLSAFDGESEVYLRWRYTSGWDWWAFVDNVEVTGDASCFDPSVDTWLSVAPAAGTVMVDDEEAVDVVVDASGLNGSFVTSLCIVTNDEEAPLFVIPVQLNVLSDAIFQDRFED